MMFKKSTLIDEEPYNFGFLAHIVIMHRPISVGRILSRL